VEFFDGIASSFCKLFTVKCIQSAFSTIESVHR